MKVLRTAVVGLGRIGWGTHVPQILNHDGFELAAVVDPLRARLEEAQRTFGVKRLYPDCEALLAGETLDLVVIASPTPYHCTQTLAAFAAGVDVFCDKPMAMDLAECDRMIAAMETHGRRLMVYQPPRTTRDIVALRHVLDRGIGYGARTSACHMAEDKARRLRRFTPGHGEG